MRIIIYPSILEKLENKHGVSASEVEEAFLNREGFLAKEMRPQNQGMKVASGLYQLPTKAVN